MASPQVFSNVCGVMWRASREEVALGKLGINRGNSRKKMTGAPLRMLQGFSPGAPTFAALWGTRQPWAKRVHVDFTGYFMLSG